MTMSRVPRTNTPREIIETPIIHRNNNYLVYRTEKAFSLRMYPLVLFTVIDADRRKKKIDRSDIFTPWTDHHRFLLHDDLDTV